MTDGTEAPKALNPWIPERDALRVAILGKLIEELTECASAAGRCLIQGIEGSEPVTGKPNRTWLFEELADVAAVCSLAFDHFSTGGGEDQRALDARMDAKVDHLTRWHDLIRVQQAHPAMMAEAGAVVGAGGSRLVDAFMAEGDYPSSTPYPTILRDFAAFAVKRLKERVPAAIASGAAIPASAAKVEADYPQPAADATVVQFPGGQK